MELAYLPPVFVEDALRLRLRIQQVGDELLEGRLDAGGERLRRRLRQPARHVAVAAQHDGAKLLGGVVYDVRRYSLRVGVRFPRGGRDQRLGQDHHHSLPVGARHLGGEEEKRGRKEGKMSSLFGICSNARVLPGNSTASFPEHTSPILRFLASCSLSSSALRLLPFSSSSALVSSFLCASLFFPSSSVSSGSGVALGAAAGGQLVWDLPARVGRAGAAVVRGRGDACLDSCSG
ncbi:hypothetical protein EYF80_003884 [Liparis tanakae]|uniref:Uncharacterized protein n=1 Tax=Liparis tanakae TaxID=230148 RepID=A0A4Z2J7H0_9TELE|nr:hypothetical protein EYF80_003884 [Liparis tanakae]